MGSVHVLPVITRFDIPVERVVEGAAKADLSDVVVIGWDAEGGFYFASSIADGADVLWLLEKAKKALLEVGE